MGFFEKLGFGLKKTRKASFESITELMDSPKITEELYEELTERLILADTGADVAEDLVDELRAVVKKNKLKTGAEALEQLKELLCGRLSADGPMDLSGHPAVILVIGVNGVGKTTSIAKLATSSSTPANTPSSASTVTSWA